MIAALLALLLAPPTAPPACVDAARDLLQVGRNEDAAAAAERCWLLSRHPTALLIASQARVYSKHHAHAAFDLDRFREHAADHSWSHDTVAELTNLVHRNTGELVLAVDPPLRPGELVGFDFEYLDAARPPLHGRTARLAFRLDPGRWRLTLHRDGYADTTADLALTRAVLRHTAHTRPIAGPSALTMTTAATRLQLGPSRALRRGVTVHLRPDDDPRAQLTFTVTDPTLALHLPPGRWHLEARAPGHAPTKATLTAGGAPIHLQLHRAP